MQYIVERRARYGFFGCHWVSSGWCVLCSCADGWHYIYRIKNFRNNAKVSKKLLRQSIEENVFDYLCKKRTKNVCYDIERSLSMLYFPLAAHYPPFSIVSHSIGWKERKQASSVLHYFQPPIPSIYFQIFLFILHYSILPPPRLQHSMYFILCSLTFNALN